jgi:hypothetical protein
MLQGAALCGTAMTDQEACRHSEKDHGDVLEEIAGPGRGAV